MRIALVAGPDPGHALPALGLARALVARRHAVVVASGRNHEAAARGVGAAFEELPLLAPSPGDDDMGHRLWVRPVEMAPPLAAALRPHRPDLVIADVLTRAGAFAAELLAVPWIELSPHHLTDPSRALPPVGLGRQPARTPWRRWDDARLRGLQAASREAGRRQELQARAALGLPPVGGAPLLRLLQTVPALEYPRPEWPEDAFVVGPVAEDLPGPALTPPAGEAPLVLVTDSTASGNGRSLAAMALDGLRHAGLRLVVTTGCQDLAAWPAAVVGRSPHGPLLDQAAVAVGPGGGGFTAKALARGVPLVVVPREGDQRETAARVRWASAGASLSPRWSTATTLRWAILRCLHDPRIRAGAGRAAASATGLGPAYAAGLVERAMSSRR